MTLGRLCPIAAFVLISVVLGSCARETPEWREDGVSHVAAPPSLGSSGEETPEPEEGTSRALALVTPYIFASYTFTDDYPQHEGKTLVLEMTEGKYDQPSSFWRAAWQGSFQFRLICTDNPAPNVRTSTNDIVSCPIQLSVNEPFQLSVADYNRDGRPDFILTNYISSSGGDTGTVYTLIDDGTVRILPIRGIALYDKSDPDALGDFFPFPYQHQDVSPLLEKHDENGFYVTYRATGGFVNFLFSGQDIRDWFAEHGEADSSLAVVRDVYQWREDAFVLARQEILEDDGSVWRSASRKGEGESNAEPSRGQPDPAPASPEYTPEYTMDPLAMELAGMARAFSEEYLLPEFSSLDDLDAASRQVSSNLFILALRNREKILARDKEIPDKERDTMLHSKPVCVRHQDMEAIGKYFFGDSFTLPATAFAECAPSSEHAGFYEFTAGRGGNMPVYYYPVSVSEDRAGVSARLIPFSLAYSWETGEPTGQVLGLLDTGAETGTQRIGYLDSSYQEEKTGFETGGLLPHLRLTVRPEDLRAYDVSFRLEGGRYVIASCRVKRDG